MTTRRAPGSAAADAAAHQVMPQDIAAEIARQIQDAGEYRAALDPRDPQRLVDLRWAALAAGRMLGRRVQLVMTKAMHDGEGPITVLMIGRPAPAQRPGIPSQRPREA